LDRVAALHAKLSAAPSAASDARKLECRAHVAVPRVSLDLLRHREREHEHEHGPDALTSK
jgi:hypothetical protein